MLNQFKKVQYSPNMPLNYVKQAKYPVKQIANFIKYITEIN